MVNSADTMANSVSTGSGDSWYTEKSPDLRPEIRGVLEKYSRIPLNEIDSHIRSIRDRAWAIHNYPCIGQWRFLDLSIGLNEVYPEILSRMRSGKQTYLDLGCAFAQDLRCLVADGVDSSKCYGSDLELDFMELGYDLFRDRETLKSEFIAADIFDANSPLQKLEGQIDIIGAASFFHLFDLEQQKTAARRTVKLLKPQKDSLIVGRQIADEKCGDRQRGDGNMYVHNVDSWRGFWNEIGDEVGVRFEVKTITASIPSRPAGLAMEFSIRRL